jgi:hypothetical protein
MKISNSSLWALAWLALLGWIAVGDKMGQKDVSTWWTQEKIADWVSKIVDHSTRWSLNSFWFPESANTPTKKPNKLSESEFEEILANQTKELEELHKKEDETLLKMWYTEEQMAALSRDMKKWIIYQNDLSKSKTIQDIQNNAPCLSQNTEQAKRCLGIRKVLIKSLSSNNESIRAIWTILWVIAQKHYDQSRRKMSFKDWKILAEADGDLNYFIGCYSQFDSNQILTKAHNMLEQVLWKNAWNGNVNEKEEIKIDSNSFPDFAIGVLTFAEKSLGISVETMGMKNIDPELFQALKYLDAQSQLSPRQ